MTLLACRSDGRSRSGRGFARLTVTMRRALCVCLLVVAALYAGCDLNPQPEVPSAGSGAASGTDAGGSGGFAGGSGGSGGSGAFTGMDGALADAATDSDADVNNDPDAGDAGPDAADAEPSDAGVDVLGDVALLD